MAPNPRLPQPKRRPVVFSLKQLVRLHCRERLMVEPVEWIGLHLELLQCSFHQPSPLPRPSREHKDEINNLLNGETCSRLVRKLYTEDSPTARKSKIIRILASRECPLAFLRDSVEFSFDRCFVGDLECHLFRHRDETSKPPVIVASIDRQGIQNLRVRRMAPRAGRRSSEPTDAICGLHVKRITPPNRLHDPYLVAILLAVAHYNRQLRGSVYSTNSYWSQVLMTDYEDEYVHLFAAHVSSAFLNKLDFPAIRPSKRAQQPLIVHHIPIPLKPYKTFRRRIFPLLLHPHAYYGL